MFVNKDHLKLLLCKFLVLARVDTISRHSNKNKLLVVVYHGVTRTNYKHRIWTQLPENIFEEQLEYLKKDYHVLSISQVISYLESNEPFPDYSALITFDDGLQNNFSVVFPLLKQYSLPAVFFLVSDYVNTNKFFWFDELFFLLQELAENGLSLQTKELEVVGNNGFENFGDLYYDVVNKMKRLPQQQRNGTMQTLRQTVNVDMNKVLEDFGMLSWKQVVEMKRSGLIEFGVHTANHRIVSNLNKGWWVSELKHSKEKLSSILGKNIRSFCFPNGKPLIDFNENHLDYLKKCGYCCAFSTEPSLYDQHKGNPMQIGRIATGNDLTSAAHYFRLNTSGFFQYIKGLLYGK